MLTLEVPHGCEGSATTEVAVRVPDGVTDVERRGHRALGRDGDRRGRLVPDRPPAAGRHARPGVLLGPAAGRGRCGAGVPRRAAVRGGGVRVDRGRRGRRCPRRPRDAGTGDRRDGRRRVEGPGRRACPTAPPACSAPPASAAVPSSCSGAVAHEPAPRRAAPAADRPARPGAGAPGRCARDPHRHRPGRGRGPRDRPRAGHLQLQRVRDRGAGRDHRLRRHRRRDRVERARCATPSSSSPSTTRSARARSSWSGAWSRPTATRSAAR